MKRFIWAAADGGSALGQFFMSVYQLILSMGGLGLFFLALADSSFLSIPEGNDILIIILSTGATWQSMLYYVMMTTAGSVTGCILLYLVGRRGGGFVERRLRGDRMQQMRRAYRRWGILTIVIPSILPPPTPFKIFVLSAGVFGVPLPRFAIAVAVGRSFRYLGWGVLAVLYGEWAKQFLEREFKQIGLVLAAIMLVLIVVLSVRYLRGRRKPQEEPA